MTSKRNECPCSRRHLWPGGKVGRSWAASKRKVLVRRTCIFVGTTGQIRKRRRLDHREGQLNTVQASSSPLVPVQRDMQPRAEAISPFLADLRNPSGAGIKDRF